MAHNLFGQRFLGRREPAWHGLGTVFPADMKVSPAEAVLRIQGDFHIQKLPLTVTMPDGKIVASDKVAIVRYPTHDDGSYHILGYGGPDYEIVQNLELGFMLEELAKEWPLETAGVLNSGKDIFLTLDAGTTKVAGEEVKQYFVLNNSHTGGRSLRIYVCGVRTVCENTLIAGSNAASIITSLPHTINVRNEASFRIDLIANMRRQQAALFESFEAMAKFKVVEDQVDEILAAAYPLPKPPKKKLLGDVVVNDQRLLAGLQDDKKLAVAALSSFKEVSAKHEYDTKRIIVFREAAKERFDVINQEHPGIAGTAWAAWNGVTETECYRNGDNKEGSTATEQSIMFGERGQAMARGYARALEIVAAG